MEIHYGTKKVEEGNSISPLESFRPPKVTFHDIKSDRLYTLLMMDPDAVGGNKIHWLIVNYQKNKSGDTILSYMGPHPPKGSGTHHYYFLLIKQKKPVKLVELENRNISMQNLFQILNLDDAFLKDRKYFTSH
jgi:phosphatidylethanolamine-binding protein (PEBP) family uncharacterized protein